MSESAAPTAPCTAVVLAAGSGRRFGGELPKQYHRIHGFPLIVHTLMRIHVHSLVERVVPVIAPDGWWAWQEHVVPHLEGLPKVTRPVEGGAERQESVRLALDSLADQGMAPEDWVAIHDGARPVVTRGLLDRLFLERGRCDALLAALPVADTVKEATAAGMVGATLDRNRIWLAQTPQMFRLGLIRRAHGVAREEGVAGTDDAALVERLGVEVLLVPGEAGNLKVTGPADLELAAFYLERST